MAKIRSKNKQDPEFQRRLNASATLLQNRQYVEAEKALLEALVIVGHENDSNAWTNLGLALKGQSRCSEAIQAFDRAIESDENPFAYLGRSQIHLMRSEFELAIADASVALKAEKQSLRAASEGVIRQAKAKRETVIRCKE